MLETNESLPIRAIAPLQARNNASSHWLSGSAPYSILINDQCSSDPRLRTRDPRCVERKTMWPDMPVRVRVLDRNENQGFIVMEEFSNPIVLQKFLENRNRLLGQETVYLVEAFDPQTVGVLGGHFRIHPSFFVEHKRVKTSDYDAFSQTDTILLPSSLSTRDHFTFKYPEPIHIYQGMPGFHVNCHITGRHIKATRSGGKMLPVGILRRKCSLWSRTCNGISDTIVLCDPKASLLKARDEHQPFPVDICPFQGGYVDFVPEKEQMNLRVGPPRSSMLDDLTFYLTHHSHLLSDRSSSDIAQTFVSKIIAGHYWELANFIHSISSHTHRSLSKQSNLTGFSVTGVEMNWSDIQSDERRSAQYCKDLEGVMLQLNIAPCAPTYAPITDWTNYQEDFRFLIAEFKRLRRITVSLNASMATLASMTGNHQAMVQQKQSLHEAKRMKALTFLGLVFIPLTYVCSLFSMQDPFAPGDQFFWVYLLVALPLVGLVSLGNWLLDKSYNCDSDTWSVRHALRAWRSKDDILPV